MGCGSSKQESSSTSANRPIQTQPPQTVGASSQTQSQGIVRTERAMSSEILEEFIRETNQAFGSIEYGIIGGAALAVYGSTRATSDLDIIVPQSVAEVVEGQLLSKNMVRTTKGGIGYVASDGGCYGIDITSDSAISQPFSASRDTQFNAKYEAPVANMSFLLNSKAYSYMTRIGPDMMEKKGNDAADILFIIANLNRQRTKVSQQECRWVVDHDFWSTFCSLYEGVEGSFQALGLQKDETPNPSNRASIRSSMERRRSSLSSRGSSRR